MFVLDLIIAVTTVFIAFVNSESIGFVKVYSQEQEQNQTQINQTFIELTGKLIGSTYRWVDFNNTINLTLIVTSGVNFLIY